MSPQAFSPEVYQQVMSGKPRMIGALAALEYSKFPDAKGHVETYAARKQDMVLELIEAGEFEAYPDALRFVMAVRAAGIVTAAASSSRNAGLLLRKIRLDTFAEKEGLTYDFLRPGLSLADFIDADTQGATSPRASPTRRSS
jgi:beta-phosphoglucomutase